MFDPIIAELAPYFTEISKHLGLKLHMCATGISQDFTQTTFWSFPFGPLLKCEATVKNVVNQHLCLWKDNLVLWHIKYFVQALPPKPA